MDTRTRLASHDLGMGMSRNALVLWFSFFSLSSIGLSLPMLFSCYSSATSSLYLTSMQTDRIVASRLALLRESDLNLTKIFGMSQISEASFFESPLPHRYLFGMSGVCRQYLIPNTSSSVHTTCTRHFFPQVDLLRYVAEDLNSTTSTPTNASTSNLLAKTNSTNSGGNFTTSPSTLVTPITPSTQLGYWVSLLNASYPAAKIDFGSRASTRARNSHVAAAILATSIPIAFLTLLATIVFRPRKYADYGFSFYAKWSVTLDLLDFILVFVAALEWTLLWVQAQNAYGSTSALLKSNTPSGVRLGWGFLLLWLAAVTKLCVTPLLIVITITVAVIIPILILWCFMKCFGVCMSGEGTAGGDNSYYDRQRDQQDAWNLQQQLADDNKRRDADDAARNQQNQNGGDF